MRTRVYDKESGKWIIVGSTEATDIGIIDIEENFESDNVEGALRELSNKIGDYNNESVADLQAQVNTHTEQIGTLREEVDWLKEHGGGGGSSLPSIKSDLTSGTITSDTELIIPVYFTSPNYGDGTLYVLVNNVEVGKYTIKQGNNNINIGLLTESSNKVQIYAKDRANLMSNQLSWTFLVGGVNLTTTFDYTVDYAIDDPIIIPYNVSVSGVSGTPMLSFSLNGEIREIPCEVGYNTISLTNTVGIGINKIEMFVTVGEYKSKTLSFNLIVSSSENLYLSSTFNQNGEFLFGNPISVNYRISKISKESFTVKRYLDNVLQKTLSQTVGDYYWIINSLEAGEHKIKIEVSSETGEKHSLEFTIMVQIGDYTPMKVNTQGLLAYWKSEGKTNDDTDRNVWVDTISGYRATLNNFNYTTNGWLDGVLVCNGTSYVEIDYKPWSDNIKLGSTIELLLTLHHSGLDTARAFDYTDSITQKGCYIDLLEVGCASAGNNRTIPITWDEELRVSFVIDRDLTNPFCKMYVNGICTNGWYLSDQGSGVNRIYENFSHQSKMYINCDKFKENFGACDVKELLVYGRPLTHDEVLKNYISGEKVLSEQEKKYKFNYENKTTPVIKMYGDTTNMTDLYQVPMRIKYESPDEDKYGQSFDLNECFVYWQGTSSLAYKIKNYSMILKENDGSDKYYNPFPLGREENIFTYKCDYMESSHCRNIGIARFVNECVYDTLNPAQQIDFRVRNTVDGFPCLMYINDVLQGAGNFNYDRYSYNAFGYDLIPDTLVYEVGANSDTTAGAFYKWTSESGVSELEYYRRDFEAIYPISRRQGNDTYDEIKALVEWVDTAEGDNFIDNFEQHFNKEYTLRYFLITYLFGLVDNLGKNMKLASFDGGRIWYPQFYDCDTSLSLDNTGNMKFTEPSIEMGDEETFNTTGSKLWIKVRQYFEADLKEEYKKMRMSRVNLENALKYIIEDQIDKIAPYYYNMDMQTKYLDYGSKYLFALHGSSEHFIKRWLRERFLYMDTLMGFTATTSEFITVRASHLGEVHLDLQVYSPMYLSVKWRDGTIETQKLLRGQTGHYTFVMPTETDQEVIVYGASNLKSIGDLSNLTPTNLILNEADKIIDLTCASSKLINMDISGCVMLRNLNLNGCTKLSPSINVSNCQFLTNIDIRNTNLNSITLNSTGGNLEKIYYPSCIKLIELRNLFMLKQIVLPLVNSCENLIVDNCPNVEPFNNDTILSQIHNININNSFTSLTGFSIFPEKLSSLSLSNMDNLRWIRIGGNCGDAYDSISMLESIQLEQLNNLECFAFTRLNEDKSIWGDGEHKRLIVKDNFVLDLSKLPKLNTFVDTLLVKELTTLLIPQQLNTVLFTNDNYNFTDSGSIQTRGNHYSTIKNIWCPKTCEHEESFEGVDGQGIQFIDFSFNYTPLIPRVINGNFKIINRKADYNRLRKENPWNFDCMDKLEGNFDYSDCQLRSYTGEFSFISTNNFNLILPTFNKTLEYSFNSAFANSEIKNLSWANMEDIINELKDNDAYWERCFLRSRFIQEYKNPEGMAIEINSHKENYSSMFFHSNINKIKSFSIPNGENFTEFFTLCNFNQSWDIINNILEGIPNATNCFRMFAGTRMLPFSEGNGLIMKMPLLKNAGGFFRTIIDTNMSSYDTEKYHCNIDKFKLIELPNIKIISDFINRDYHGTDFEMNTISWDDVNDMLSGLGDTLEDCNAAFYKCLFSDFVKYPNGLVFENNGTNISTYEMFFNSNLTKVDRVVLPNAVRMHGIFLRCKNLTCSADFINDIFKTCCLDSNLINEYYNYYKDYEKSIFGRLIAECINIGDFEKYDGIIYDRPDLSPSFGGDMFFDCKNISKVSKFNGSFYNLANTFRGMEYLQNSWDIFIDIVQNNANILESLSFYCYGTYPVIPPSYEELQLDLPLVTGLYGAFSQYLKPGEPSDEKYREDRQRFNYNITKLNIPKAVDGTTAFRMNGLRGISNVNAPELTDAMTMFEACTPNCLKYDVENVYMPKLRSASCMFNVYAKDNRVYPSTTKFTNFNIGSPNGMNTIINVPLFPSLTEINFLNVSNFLTHPQGLYLFSGGINNSVQKLVMQGTIRSQLINFPYNLKALNHESLVNIIDCLEDRSATTPLELTFTSEQYSKLTDEDKQKMVDKNWTAIVK